jgi:hypothetical protein
VVHTHATAHGDVKAGEIAVFLDGNEAQVLRKNVDVI